ncbi:MAG: hypothetical protein WCO00_06860 [Rhodospirillaceae bacterium]
MATDPPRSRPDSGADQRKARQAAALRDNLSKRKAQQRARRDEGAAADARPEDTPLAPGRPPG